MKGLPDFLIVGTQKGGTTWLEHQLGQHADVFTPRRQLHFFDRNFDKGLTWYKEQFLNHGPDQAVGEKTTEYFDTVHGDEVALRIARSVPDARLIVILRNPVDRAISAFSHMVNSGLQPIPKDPNADMFRDQQLDDGKGWRYIERGYYAQQLEALYRHIPADQILVLIFEHDIIADPQGCWKKVCRFLDIKVTEPSPEIGQKVNTLRLSPPAIWLSRVLYSVPRARGIIRRLDRMIGLKPWTPKISQDTRERLAQIYGPHNRALAKQLGRDLSIWEASR